MLSVDATVHILWLLTPITASISGITVLTSLSIDSWLDSEEKILNPSYRNGSSKVEFLTKLTSSGLFTLCATQAGYTEFQCERIDYFPAEDYSPDPNDSTMAIPYTVLKSVGFILSAIVLLMLAEILCLTGHCCKRRRILTFLSGITFITSGLFLMLGMVIYIATLKGEVADKLRPRSTFHPPLFAYKYGWSTYLTMVAFITSEAAGISAVFLYIYWHKRDWSKKEEEQLFNSQLLISTPPPPCLKHPRQRSLSFHTNHERDALDSSLMRRARSQQLLKQSSEDRNSSFTIHDNHVNDNQYNHYNQRHSQECPRHYRQSSLNNSQECCNVSQQTPCCSENQQYFQYPENHHTGQSKQWTSQNPQRHSLSQSYIYHQKNPSTSNKSSRNSVHWASKSFEYPPPSPKYHTRRSKSDYLDEIMVSRDDSLPRSHRRDDSDSSHGGATLPRSFPRSCDDICGSYSRGRDESLLRNYAKDDTALCDSLSRKYPYHRYGNVQYNQSNRNTACCNQGVACSLCADCCSCCAYCYCCCYCPEENNKYNIPKTNLHKEHVPFRNVQRPSYQIPRNRFSNQQQPGHVSCSAGCNSFELDNASRMTYPDHYRQMQPQQNRLEHQQRQHRQLTRQSASFDMANVHYSPPVDFGQSAYQHNTYRQTSPV